MSNATYDIKEQETIYRNHQVPSYK